MVAAKLEGADLNNANLTKADMRECNLRKASLLDANLSNVVLNYADLGNADLTGADVDGAYAYESRWTGVKLSENGNLRIRTFEGRTRPLIARMMENSRVEREEMRQDWLRSIEGTQAEWGEPKIER